MNILGFFVKGRSKEFDSFISLKELGFALGLNKSSVLITSSLIDAIYNSNTYEGFKITFGSKGVSKPVAV